MKNALATFLLSCVVVQAGVCDDIRYGTFDNVIMLPDQEVYNDHAYTTYNNFPSNTLLVIPSCVTNISSAAITGGSTTDSAGYFITWSSGNVKTWLDAPISDRGGSNVLFMGMCPKISDVSGNNRHVVGRAVLEAPYYWESTATGYYKWHIKESGQFLDCTVWFVEGEDGWTNGGAYCGGVTKPGAVRAVLTPCVDSGKFIYQDSESIILDIACTNIEAQIYYTLDGTEPTTNSLLYVSPIEIGCATVKAMAYVPGYPFTIISSCSYGQGETEEPSISASAGSEFYWSGNMITLETATAGAQIRYTLDGSEPNERSMLYVAPFPISDTVTVKAKSFKENWFESETTTASFTRLWHVVELPSITPSGAVFENVSQAVEITCATEGAEIWYTVDGSDPATNGTRYDGAFVTHESCTVRAIAKKHDWANSEEATSVLTRAEGLSEAANLYGYLMETDGSYPWTVVTDVSHDGVSCVRSGAIGHGGTTWLQTSVRKAGTVSFWWKAACEEAEEEDGETYWYDYGSFLVDGVEKAQIAGNDTGWRKVVVEVPAGGKHVLKWEYRKDGATSYAPDCVWLDQVQWIPADGGGYTLTTPEPVPYAWLSGYGLGLDSDFETAAKNSIGKRDGDGKALQVWQDYVAGTDPTNAASVFAARIEMIGDIPQITWSPDLNTNGIERTYTIWGKADLKDAAWHSPTNAADRFFKVSVGMP